MGDIIVPSITQSLKGLTLTAYVSQATVLNADGTIRDNGRVMFIFFNGTGNEVDLDPFDIKFFNLGQ